MKTYEIKIEIIEKAVCELDAENEDDAISKAFSVAYSWHFYRDKKAPIKVYVKEVSSW